MKERTKAMGHGNILRFFGPLYFTNSVKNKRGIGKDIAARALDENHCRRSI